MAKPPFMESEGRAKDWEANGRIRKRHGEEGVIEPKEAFKVLGDVQPSEEITDSQTSEPVADIRLGQQVSGAGEQLCEVRQEAETPRGMITSAKPAAWPATCAPPRRYAAASGR